MNRFYWYRTPQTTKLAVVSPGSAEALLATGAGDRVLQIPAVVLYNILARIIK
jgi:biopolymer transport protein ExbB/TolQ